MRPGGWPRGPGDSAEHASGRLWVSLASERTGELSKAGDLRRRGPRPAWRPEERKGESALPAPGPRLGRRSPAFGRGLEPRRLPRSVWLGPRANKLPQTNHSEGPRRHRLHTQQRQRRSGVSPYPWKPPRGAETIQTRQGPPTPPGPQPQVPSGLPYVPADQELPEERGTETGPGPRLLAV